MKSSLFICGTPFQFFIATKIIKQKNIPNCYLLYLGNVNDDRFSKYFTENKELFIDAIFFYIDEMLKEASNKKKHEFAKKIIKNRDFESVFLSNYYNIFYSFILSQIDYSYLYSFDDGVDNINPESPMYKANKFKLFKKLKFKYKYKLKILPHQIRERILIHFSIFKNKKNIIDNVEYIELFEMPKLPKNTKTKKIFIGSYFYDMFNEHEKIEKIHSQLTNFIHKYGIDEYLPHPREEKFTSEKLKSINTLSEEYILDLIKRGYFVELYGFASTVQLALSNCKNIKNYILVSETIHEKIKNIYLTICDNSYTELKL